MKLAKKILGITMVLVIVLLLFALFVDQEFKIEKQVEINASQNEVFLSEKFEKPRFLQQMGKMDPNMDKSFYGNDGTVGFIASWKSQNPDVGSGEQEIIKIEENKRIDFELRFKEPMEANNTAFFIIEQISKDKSLVKWGFEGEIDYPFNLMLPFMNMDKVIGDDLQIGLNNLKELMEQNTNKIVP
jgi:hypothetical protein